MSPGAQIITAKSRGKITREIATRHQWKGSRGGVKIRIVQASELPIVAHHGKLLLWEVARGSYVYSGTADTVFDAAAAINALTFTSRVEPARVL
jgi:hypothetical protein